MKRAHLLAAAAVLLTLLAVLLVRVKQQNAAQTRPVLNTSPPPSELNAISKPSAQPLAMSLVTNFTSQVVVPSLGQFIITLKTNGVFFPFNASDFVVMSQKA